MLNLVSKDLFGINQAQLAYLMVAKVFPVLANGIAHFLSYNLDVVVLLVFAFTIFLLGSWRMSLPFLAAATFYWSQLLIYSVLVLPILIGRTALPGIIPLAGFVGIQIATIHKQKIRIVLTIGLVLFCFIFAIDWMKNEAGKPIEDWKKISQLLDSMTNHDDIILLYPGFIQFPLRFYTELPSETTIAISIESDMDELERDIQIRLNEHIGDSIGVFLVVRYSDVLSNPKVYQQLLDFLTTYLGKPTLFREVKGVVKLLLIRYENRKFKSIEDDL